jgi:hypothetical protein
VNSKLNKEGRAKRARPSSRFLCPRPLLGKPHQRNGTIQSSGQRNSALLYGFREFRPSGHSRVAEGLRADFFGASSVASALGIRHGRDPAAERCGSTAGPVLEPELQPRPLLRIQRPRPPASPPTRSLPQEDLGIPRRLVDLLQRSQFRHSNLGCPRSGRDPSWIVFRLAKGENAPRARLLFLMTQRNPFSVTYLNGLTGPFDRVSA